MTCPEAQSKSERGRHQAPGPNSITPRDVNCTEVDGSCVRAPDGTEVPPAAPTCQPSSQSLRPGWGRNETTKNFLETARDELCRFGKIAGAARPSAYLC